MYHHCSLIFHLKIQVLSQKILQNPKKISQQNSGPTSVILNSDELGGKRENNEIN